MHRQSLHSVPSKGLAAFNVNFLSLLIKAQSLVNFGIALPTVQSCIDIVLFCSNININMCKASSREVEFDHLLCSFEKCIFLDCFECQTPEYFTNPNPEYRFSPINLSSTTIR